jgi:hypothetical protein
MSSRLKPSDMLTRLTSPKSAVLILVVLGGYSIAAPALKVPSPFSNPVFLLGVAWLAVATAVCAWRRTAAAATWLRAPGSALPSNPSVILTLPARLAPADALARARTSARALRLRPADATGSLTASGNRFGVLGSPVFHWALVLLFAVAASGQATRSFALMDLAVGEGKPAALAGYLAPPIRGPLARPGRGGLTLELDRIDQRYIADGVDHGPVPVVSARRKDGRVAASGPVYPNSPLHVGALTVHRADVGLAAQIRVADAASGQVEVRTLYFPNRDGLARPVRFAVTTLDGRTVRVEARPERGRKVRLALLGSSGQPAATWMLAAGGADVATLPGGIVVRVAELTRYAQLGLVEDWSTPWLYAIFALVCFSAAVPVFWPPRLLGISYHAEKDGAPRLEIRIRAAGNDPAFAGRVERAMTAAFMQDEGA